MQFVMRCDLHAVFWVLGLGVGSRVKGLRFSVKGEFKVKGVGVYQV